MSRLRLDLQYDGSEFCGWQIQPKDPSVQEELEQHLTKLNGQKSVAVVGCGRTDAGVHAMHYVAHCDFDTTDLESLTFKLNSMLSRGVSILKITEVHPDFHARFDATKRTYRYFINKRKNPFNERYAHFTRKTLDVEAMNQAAQFLLGHQDFESFAKQHSDVSNHFCQVYTAFWMETEDQYVFEISANRFLRNMVRAIVGTLLEVGLSKIPPDTIPEIIAKKNRDDAGSSVPGKGLFLWEIVYP
jgi:tRNA pseudouridine38-40 synthase